MAILPLAAFPNATANVRAGASGTRLNAGKTSAVRINVIDGVHPNDGEACDAG